MVKKIKCKKRIGKKGFALDILFIGIFLFALAIGFLAFNNAFNTAIDQMKENDQINATNATVEALTNTQEKVLGKLDYIILGAFIGLTLALLITAWMIGGNPIFVFFYFIFIVIAVVLASILSGAWEQVTELAVFTETIVEFPVAMHLINNLPFYVAIIGFIGLVLTFVKPFMFGEE